MSFFCNGDDISPGLPETLTTACNPGMCLLKLPVIATAIFSMEKGDNETMEYQVQENCLTIYLPAEVDHHNAEEMKREADKLIGRDHIKYVIFDFENTDFMDSSGIGVIMGRYKTISLIGGEVWAVHTNARIRKILTLSGVTKIMQIYEEEEE